ncbi:nucleoside diphosphate kinase 7 [Drosophila pseudoobscura]|uniref:Nucleoside diphosphate kinase 7 n=1 Tax=Drosophila pseudoobscura pseudoobscura TaxID=46245 RepID=A0A6I8UR96_DROPS|nr:nucleoside diphosphate kinase 7 [Drosophila pseudoobscura]
MTGAAQAERRLAFVAEWYQAEAAIIRTFLVTYFVADEAVEVFDQRSKKTFLRRTKIPELTQRDFFVGSKINVFGRQFDIVDYADESTRSNLAKYRKRGFVLLKNNMWHKHLGKFLKTLINNKININNGQMVQFTPKMVTQFLSGKPKNEVVSSVLMNELLAGPAISMELIGDNVVEIMIACVKYKGPDGVNDSSSVKLSSSLEELFEQEDVRYGIYCPATEEDVAIDLKFFFEDRLSIMKECLFKNSTLAIIKPHSIKDGLLGDIVDEILANGFNVTAMRMILMARINCEEFYEVYRGILPEYIPMVAQLASGVCMCLEIVSADPGKSSYGEFRTFCGPMDPEIAKLLRPHTLRAKFGKSKVLNAIHCTDLPDDTNLELQYMFKILD